MAESEDEIIDISSDEEVEKEEQPIQRPIIADPVGIIDLVSDDDEEQQEDSETDAVAAPGAVAPVNLPVPPAAAAAAAALPPPHPPQPRRLPTEEQLMNYAEEWSSSRVRNEGKSPAHENTFLELCAGGFSRGFSFVPAYQFFYLRSHDPDRLEREVFQFCPQRGYPLHVLLRATEDSKGLVGTLDPRNIILPLLRFARVRDAETEGSKGSRYLAMMMFECSYPKNFAGVKALHLAAMGKHISIEIMEEIINAYPQALNQTAGRKMRKPLDFLEWKYFPDGGRTPAPTELSQADKLRGEFITAQLVEHSDILEADED